ncbi:hypothetical protein J6590_056160 [Homalodisca vitripennis]|nr:hypothetical protein J6590_056160 [Homalodisca vitripennis]
MLCCIINSSQCPLLRRLVHIITGSNPGEVPSDRITATVVQRSCGQPQGVGLAPAIFPDFTASIAIELCKLLGDGVALLYEPLGLKYYVICGSIASTQHSVPRLTTCCFKTTKTNKLVMSKDMTAGRRD